MVEKANFIDRRVADRRHRGRHHFQRGRQESAAHYFRKLRMRLGVLMERLIWLPVSVIGVAAITALPMLMDNTPPAEYIPGSQSVVVEDDRIILSYGLVRRRLCDAVVTRSIVDPNGRLEHLTPMSYTAEQVQYLQDLQNNRISLILPRPARAVAGTYSLQVTVRYSCNFAQEVWPIKVTFSVPYRLME